MTANTVVNQSVFHFFIEIFYLRFFNGYNHLLETWQQQQLQLQLQERPPGEQLDVQPGEPQPGEPQPGELQLGELLDAQPGEQQPGELLQNHSPLMKVALFRDGVNKNNCDDICHNLSDFPYSELWLQNNEQYQQRRISSLLLSEYKLY